jgi:hypothetical protein
MKKHNNFNDIGFSGFGCWGHIGVATNTDKPAKPTACLMIAASSWEYWGFPDPLGSGALISSQN